MNLVKKYCLGIVAILMVVVCTLPLPSFAKVLTPDWSYQGQTNPRNWSKIARNFAPVARSGKISRRSILLVQLQVNRYRWHLIIKLRP